MSKRMSSTGGESALPKGIFAASLTPLREDLSIDTDALSAHCAWLFERGCDGIALFGTTGEATSFTIDERKRALEAVVESGVSPGHLVVGTGCCAIPDAVELTRHALAHGIGAVLVYPPFYYKGVDDDGVYDAYDRIFDGVADERLRVCLYHYPQMTGVGLSRGLIERLVTTFPEIIVGVKDSSGDWENTKMMCESFPTLNVYPGTEIYLLDVLRVGGAGCISATLNVTSRLGAEIFDGWATGDMAALQNRLIDIRVVFDGFPLIAALKHAMYRYSDRREWLYLRPPLSSLGEEEVRRLERALDARGFFAE